MHAAASRQHVSLLMPGRYQQYSGVGDQPEAPVGRQVPPPPIRHGYCVLKTWRLGVQPGSQHRVEDTCAHTPTQVCIRTYEHTCMYVVVVIAHLHMHKPFTGRQQRQGNTPLVAAREAETPSLPTTAHHLNVVYFRIIRIHMNPSTLQAKYRAPAQLEARLRQRRRCVRRHRWCGCPGDAGGVPMTNRSHKQTEA